MTNSWNFKEQDRQVIPGWKEMQNLHDYEIEDDEVVIVIGVPGEDQSYSVHSSTYRFTQWLRNDKDFINYLWTRNKTEVAHFNNAFQFDVEHGLPRQFIEKYAAQFGTVVSGPDRKRTVRNRLRKIIGI